jgi:hypothetical protein
MVVKIENYEGTADSFTFPYNPLVFDNTSDSNFSYYEYNLYNHSIIVGAGNIKPSSVIITGHFSGVDRWTNYRKLSKHFSENNKLKKLFFESDKFYLGVGKQLKKTHSGERTNFIDYVGMFQCVIGKVFGNTLKTTGTNEGNSFTYVSELTARVTSGASNIVLSDGLGTSITIKSGAFATNNYIKYELVTMLGGGDGSFVSEYRVISISTDGTTFTRTIDVTSTALSGLLMLDSGANVSTIGASNTYDLVVKFRDGYSD